MTRSPFRGHLDPQRPAAPWEQGHFWGQYPEEAELPNVSGAKIQLDSLQAGDVAWVTDDSCLYVCIDPTVGSAVWESLCTGVAGGQVVERFDTGESPLQTVSVSDGLKEITYRSSNQPTPSIYTFPTNGQVQTAEAGIYLVLAQLGFLVVAEQEPASYNLQGFIEVDQSLGFSTRASGGQMASDYTERAVEELRRGAYSMQGVYTVGANSIFRQRATLSADGQDPTVFIEYASLIVWRIQ